MIDVYEDACVCASIHRGMTHEYRMHDSGNMQESLVRIVEQFTTQMKPAFPWWAVYLTVIFLTFLQEIPCTPIFLYTHQDCCLLELRSRTVESEAVHTLQFGVFIKLSKKVTAC